MNNEYAKQRINLLNNWGENNLLESEEKFKQLIDGIIVLEPVKMKFDSSKEYQICVSYLIDAFQQLKYNPDIAMERVLLAIDSYSGDKKLVEVYEGAVNLVDEKISNYDLVLLFEKFCESIPDKTQAFLASRLFRDFDYLITIENSSRDIITKQQNASTKQLWSRLCLVQGNLDNEKSTMFSMLKKIAFKYKLYDKQKNVQPTISEIKSYDGIKRKISRLIRKSLIDTVEISGSEFTLSQKDKLLLLIQGLLQTMRNDRMHGKDISPFKSSKANISTYQHYYYCFLLAYFILLLQFDFCMEDVDFVKNLKNNISQSLDIINSWK